MTWFKRNSNVVLMIFGLLSVSLGTLGYYTSVPNQFFSFIDFLRSIFVSLAQLTLNGFAAPEKDKAVNYLIVSSQFFAVLFFSVGLIRIFSEFTEDFGKLRFWWKSKFGKNLDLIIGLGWHGHELAKFHTDPKSEEHANTIAIDLSPSNEAIQQCKKSKIIWRRGDVLASDLINSFPTKNIARVFVVTGSDEGNVFVLRHLSKVPKEGSRLKCMVAVRSPGVFETMLDDNVREILDIRIFNDHESTTRLLLNKRSEAWDFSHNVKSCRLVLVGKGAMLDALLFQWLQQMVFEANVAVEIDVLHPDGHINAAQAFVKKYACYKTVDTATLTGAKAELTAVRPVDGIWLTEKVLPEIRFHSLPDGPGHQVQWLESYFENPESSHSNTIVSVMFDQPEYSVGVAKNILPTINLYKGKFSGSNNVQVVAGWVYLNTQDEGSFSTIEKALKQQMSDVWVYCDYLGNCSKDSVANDDIERAGMRVHASYSGAAAEDAEALWFGGPKYRAGKATPPATLWDRESSRLSGAHAWVKHAISMRFSSEKRCDYPTTLDSVAVWDMEVIMVLAQVEHRRWCAVHLLRGWLPLVALDEKVRTAEEVTQVQKWYSKTDGGKNLFRSQWKHLCLVPFKQLESLDAILPGDKRGEFEKTKDLAIVKDNNSIIEYAARPRLADHHQHRTLPVLPLH